MTRRLLEAAGCGSRTKLIEHTTIDLYWGDGGGGGLNRLGHLRMELRTALRNSGEG